MAILKWNLERIKVYVCIHYIFYGRVSTNLTKEPTLKLPDPGYSLSPDLSNAATTSVSLIEGKTAKFGEKWSSGGKI